MNIELKKYQSKKNKRHYEQANTYGLTEIAHEQPYKCSFQAVKCLQPHYEIIDDVNACRSNHRTKSHHRKSHKKKHPTFCSVMLCQNPKITNQSIGLHKDLPANYEIKQLASPQQAYLLSVIHNTNKKVRKMEKELSSVKKKLSAVQHETKSCKNVRERESEVDSSADDYSNYQSHIRRSNQSSQIGSKGSQAINPSSQIFSPRVIQTNKLKNSHILCRKQQTDNNQKREIGRFSRIHTSKDANEVRIHKFIKRQRHRIEQQHVKSLPKYVNLHESFNPHSVNNQPEQKSHYRQIIKQGNTKPKRLRLIEPQDSSLRQHNQKQQSNILQFSSQIGADEKTQQKIPYQNNNNDELLNLLLHEQRSHRINGDKKDSYEKHDDDKSEQLLFQITEQEDSNIYREFHDLIVQEKNAVGRRKAQLREKLSRLTKVIEKRKHY